MDNYLLPKIKTCDLGQVRVEQRGEAEKKC